MFRCADCGRKFIERTGTPFNHLESPTDIVFEIVRFADVPSFGSLSPVLALSCYGADSGRQDATVPWDFKSRLMEEPEFRPAQYTVGMARREAESKRELERKGEEARVGLVGPIQTGGTPAHSANKKKIKVFGVPSTLPEVEIVRRATEIIGPELVAEWMRSPVKALQGRTPYSLLGSSDGRKEVGRVLTRIEHGVY